MDKPKLNLMCPVNQLGYGIVGLNILLELSKVANVAWWPIGSIQAPQYSAQFLEAALKKAQTFEYHDSPSVRIFHQFLMAESIGRGKRVGWPIFELNKFSDIEKNHLLSLDKIIVCSKWAEEIIWKIKPNGGVSVVPLGVDRNIFHEKIITEKSDSCLFYTIGKWEVRKGHDVVLEAFNKAFSATDDVKLVMCCSNSNMPERNKEWENFYKSSKLGNKIAITPKLNTQNDVASLMSMCDCGLFLSRAEGWNLELLESLSVGKSVIATNYSAHTEFINKDCAHLININDIDDAYDEPYFYGQGQWGKIGEKELNQVVEYMRLVYEDKKKGNLKTNIAGIDVAKQFSWANSARTLINVCQT